MNPPAAESHPLTAYKEWWYATGLLVVVFSLFVVSTMRLSHGDPWPILRAFAEAATVGALADWFAVVALFKAPLGLGFLVGRLGFIGHLAVLPKSQPAIAERAGDYVGTHVLTPAAIAHALREVPMAELIVRGLSDQKDHIAEASAEDSWAIMRPLLRAQTGVGIDWIAGSLSGNPKTKAKADAAIASGIQAWLESHPYLVGSMVRSKIAEIPAAQFSAHAQTMIGRELQFIRINGTLVGGLVGLLLYGIEAVIS